MEFRLQVFYTVAQRLSFTKASEELFISQPAITRHIHALEMTYQTPLFERSGNRKVVLTEAGHRLLAYVEQLASLHREMEFAMDELTHHYSGTIRLGASSTISQYVLPRRLAHFHRKFPEVTIQLSTGNTENIQSALLEKNIDLGIVEGADHVPELKYEEYLADELALVCNYRHPLTKRKDIGLKELRAFPWLVREQGSGTLKVIVDKLAASGIRLADLKIEMQLGGTESIKAYLQESDCLAFVSVHAITEELKINALQMLEINDFSIERSFRFIEPHGAINTNASLLKKFLKENR